MLTRAFDANNLRPLIINKIVHDGAPGENRDRTRRVVLSILG